MIRVVKALPSEYESGVAELLVSDENEKARATSLGPMTSVDVPIRITRENELLEIEIYTPAGDLGWKYPLDELLDAIRVAASLLEPPIR